MGVHLVVATPIGKTVVCTSIVKSCHIFVQDHIMVVHVSCLCGLLPKGSSVRNT
jgi:hypothetical protein